jgi:DNA-binding MarR family transcriptional regulator
VGAPPSPQATPDAPALGAEDVLDLLYRRDLAMGRARRALARRLGLSDDELAALLHLAHGELRTTELRELLDLSSGGATAFVHRLEAMGHATRRRHPRDGRSALIGLTPGTAAALTRAEAALSDGLDEALAALDEDQQAVVGRFLGRLVALAEGLVEPPAQARGRPVPSLWG